MERWQVLVELTLDKEEGDAEWKALIRARAALEKMTLGIDVAHWHIIQGAKTVQEFD
jgi:hypothetical protein